MSARSTSRPAWAALGALVAGYAALDLVAGARSSPLVPPFPRGVGAPGWTSRGARAVGLDHLSQTALTALALGVLGVLAIAFVTLVIEALRGRVGSWAAAVAVAASLALAVAAPLLLSRDVYNYAAYGRLLAVHGTNPYERPPSTVPGDPFTPVVSRAWVDTRSVYGPVFTLASGGIARAWAGSPGATILAFKVLAGVAMGFAAWFSWVACRVLRPGREALALGAVGLNPVIVVHTVGGGHNDALVAACLAGALALAAHTRSARDPGPPEGRARWRWFAVTALLTLATLVKVVAVLPLALWVWWLLRSGPRGRRVRLAATHVGLATALAVAVTAPVFAGWRTFTAVGNLASRQGWASGARLVARGARSLGDALTRVWGGSSTASSAGSVLSTLAYTAFLLLFAMALVHFVRRHRAAQAAHLEWWGASLLLFALAAPYLLPWYAAWFVPLVALFADDALLWIGIVASVVLALTGVPAEPAGDPGLWRDMMLGVHYGAAPAMLALLLLAMGRVIREPAPPPAPAEGGPRRIAAHA
jgi:alpha-1,6-mannosyltransferase